MSGKVFTWAEVAKHTSRDSCYVVLHDNVYDVTHFIDDHPGGAAFILQNAGDVDATVKFEEAGHGDDARTLLKDFLIGTLDLSSEKPKKQTSGSQASKTSTTTTATATAKTGSVEETGNGMSLLKFIVPLCLLLLTVGATFGKQYLV